MSNTVSIENFIWWLSLLEPTNIADNQFELLNNFFYNKDKRIETRRGITTFWNSIWTNPITSYFFFQRDDTWVRIAICTAWTNMYKYDEWTWNRNSIKSWLSEFESDWVTRTRWSFAVYKNIIYMCNWVNSYASYDWTTYTEYATQPKVRYLQYMSDIIFGAWEDINPSTLYYINSASADANTLNTNAVVVWWDELWRINWLKELGSIILVFKNSKIYSIDLSGPSSTPIDWQNGWYWQRNIKNVWNSLLYFNDTWFDTLKARQWVSGADWLETLPLSDSLRPLIWNIEPKQYNNVIWLYARPLTNYYTSFNTVWTDINNNTLVYSALTRWWSSYNLPSCYDYWYYIDSNWKYHYLIASASWWQMFEIETWFDDLWSNIEYELKTKQWDFWKPWLYKTFDYVDIIWLKSKWNDIECEIIIDWEVESSGIISDTNIVEWISATKTLWSSPIWSLPLTWPAITKDIEVYKYLIRIPLYSIWNTIQVRMYSNWVAQARTLDKITISKQDEAIDIFPYANIS